MNCVHGVKPSNELTHDEAVSFSFDDGGEMVAGVVDTVLSIILQKNNAIKKTQDSRHRDVSLVPGVSFRGL